MATLTSTSKLDAVNSILIGIGEAPVNTLGSGLQEAEIAEVTLDNVSREVQSRGWTFNTDLRYTLSKNSDGIINLPLNCLKVDVTSVLRDYDTDVVERDRKLYDRVKNSFIFTEDIETDIVVLLEFHELPENARRFITLRAARKFQENILGSSTLSQLQADEEQNALFALREAEAEVGDYTIFDQYDTYRHLDRHINTTNSTLT
tara:strand:- start:770 stop:1381 length:612 start_codon:yes stop_codon:yes gene_type:complete